MESLIDIFAQSPDGSPVWIEVIEGLGNARARIKQLRRIVLTDYFLYSERDGTIQREDYPAAQKAESWIEKIAKLCGIQTTPACESSGPQGSIRDAGCCVTSRSELLKWVGLERRWSLTVAERDLVGVDLDRAS